MRTLRERKLADRYEPNNLIFVFKKEHMHLYEVGYLKGIESWKDT